jgi:hypothetical protein
MNSIFVEVAGVTILMSLLAFYLNAYYYNIVQGTIRVLTKEVKPTLMGLGQFDQARNIALIELPKLTQWLKSSRSHGYTNVLGIAIPVILLLFNAVYPDVAYIGIWSCLAFFLANLIGLPRSIFRIHKAIMGVSGHLYLISTLELQKNVTDITNDTKQNIAGVD